MKRFVRFRGQPIKFRSDLSGKLIADIVPVGMASLFDDDSDAYNRAWLQWGDNGMEHCEFCKVTADEPTPKPARRAPVTPAPAANQGKLL